MYSVAQTSPRRKNKAEDAEISKALRQLRDHNDVLAKENRKLRQVERIKAVGATNKVVRPALKSGYET